MLISFGILAALPFRHNPASSSDPAVAGEATGPTPADLGRTNLDFFVQADKGVGISESLPSELPRWKVPNNSGSTPPIPSTFEDIAVPLRLDAYDEERLSVSTTKQMKSLAKTSSAGDVSQRPFAPKRSIAANLRGDGENHSKVVGTTNRFGSSFRDQHRTGEYRSAKHPSEPNRPQSQHSVLTMSQDARPLTRKDPESVATLASTEVSNAASPDKSVWREPVERLPKRSADNRKRHWIRQPN